MLDIRDFGAQVGLLCTDAIQSAIDMAHQRGGDRVQVPAGTWISGTIELRSGVELHLGAGACLTGSDNPADYRATEVAGEYGGSASGFLIVADDCKDIAISGRGCIDGRGQSFMEGFRSTEGPYIRKPKSWRPRGIGLTRCQQVTLSDFTIRDAAQWTIHLTGCEDVLCQGLRILNALDIPNNDGIDPDRCRRVRIIGCHIEAGDDCIVLKCTKDHPELGDCEDIVISGCTLISTSAALKIGTESHGNFRRIVATGNTISRSHRGLTIQLRDGGHVEDIIFADTVIETRHFHPMWWGQAEAVSITAVPRQEGVQVGSISRVSLRNLICRGENGIFIHGDPSAPICDLSMDGIQVAVGRSSKWPGGQHDLRPSGGEEHGGLYVAPCPAIYLAHTRDAHLHKLRVRWLGEPAEWFSHALEAHDCPGLHLDTIDGGAASDELPAVLIDGDAKA
ncbi:MAG: glycoside hydrolase family 28 protein [Planctomycetota bacterium]|nr:MAG: glycoside hydrolase family 28 protein [Planctomycetota bacterium]